jgi:kynureninase
MFRPTMSDQPFDPATVSAELASRLDREDPLRAMRDRFVLPAGVLYLDGNSLGALPKDVAERVRRTAEEEWGRDLITSWNKAGWIELPKKVGGKIGRLIGAAEGTVVATDSTSVNLFKVLSAALAMKPERRKIVSERDNFPTDLYMAEGLAALLDREHRLVLADRPEDIPGLIDADTAVIMLTHVNYKTGLIHDMAGLTAAAHRAGALTIWDLAHSAGALPVDLSGAEADFAIGCGYKYLNGGPGAPAFVYVAPHAQEEAVQPLTGWFSHARPFAFEPGFAPADGIERFLCGTPPVLSLAALDAALDAWQGVDMNQLRRKSMQLTDFFVAAVEKLCMGYGLELASPRDAGERGSQISFALPEKGYAVMQALIARGVIGDFRAPDIMRFGFAPLYVGFEDCWKAAETLADILATGAWERPEFKSRAAVT